MAAYETFGWNYSDVATLPSPEADLLAIYFEEKSAYLAEEHEKLRNQSGGYDATTYAAIGDDEDDDE